MPIHFQKTFKNVIESSFLVIIHKCIHNINLQYSYSFRSFVQNNFQKFMKLIIIGNHN